MSGARVSVIVPAFDAERYLAEAIDSVLAEGEAIAEIVVVDDGSKDGTASLAERAPKTVVVRQPNSGIATARNRGVAASRSPIVAFIDADDVWVPGRLALQLPVLAAATTETIVLGHAEEFISPDLTAAEATELRPKPGRHPGWLPGAMLMSRATFDRIGGFEPTLPVGEAIAFFQRATLLGIAQVVLPELVLRRRLHRDNFTRTPRARSDYALLAKHLLDTKRKGLA